MTSLADEYQRWFEAGNRDLAEFLADRNYTRQSLADCVLTDQYLRHQQNEAVPVDHYTARLPDVACDTDLQKQLWLEEFGYLEERSHVPRDEREQFLSRIPETLRTVIAAELRLEMVTAQSGREIQADRCAQAPYIARYRIDSEIGRGSFGIVYRGWDQQLERTVAIKVLQSGQSTEALFTEARMAAGLDIPGVVSVYDCGQAEDGEPYLVTAFVDGTELNTWADSAGRSDRKRIVRLFQRLCEALEQAHQEGIIHRDIKPSNILVKDNDQPVLLDFGLAVGRWRTGRSGELVGTPAYMSPEQARGEGHLVDARSDVFSTGIVLIEVLTGRRPWNSESSRELLREIAHGQARTAQQLDRQIPVRLDRICSKATAAAMSQRYDSMAAFAEDLRWFCDAEATQTAGTPSRTQVVGPCGLRPYGSADAHVFRQLLPGQRDGRGVPDLVRWWLDQLNVTDHQPARHGVLVLSGPSGSGKSSLLHAGVLPFLDQSRTRCLSIDASELRPDRPLSDQFSELHRLETVSADDPSLASLMAAWREQSELRTVIVLDQFEQIFTWSAPTLHAELLFALRQADGKQLQFVLVVRDEFWSAISQLMRNLDSPLRDGRNAMALERFSRRHAETVLRAWARSVNTATNDSAAEESVSDQFITAAVQMVTDNDRVVPVRLALLAAILGDEDWTEERLQTITSQGSLSGYYLESVLGDLAPAARQRLAAPAKELLRNLIPATGRLRGPSKSAEQLSAACRSAGGHLSEADFADLLDLLERQTHLITPVERTGPDEQSDADRAITCYQLSHDFLVTEIRQWLDAADQTTIRGRARLDLVAAVARWEADPASRNLAGPLDCVRFGLITRPRKSAQRNFVRASARRQLFRGSAVLLACVILGTVFQFTLRKSQGEQIVRRLLDSKLDELPAVVDETRRNIRWTRNPLQSLLASTQHLAIEQRDRIALTTMPDEPDNIRYLADRLPQMVPAASRLFAEKMREDLTNTDLSAVVSRLAMVVTDETEHANARLKAAIALATVDPVHSFWTQAGESICQQLVDANPTDLGWLAEGLSPVRHQLLPGLAAVRDNLDPSRVRTATFLLAEFSADQPESLVDLVEHAELGQLNAIFPTLANAPDAVDPLLRQHCAAAFEHWEQATADMHISRNTRHSLERLAAMSSLSVTLARRVGNLSAALILRGDDDVVTPHLQFRDDPTIRSYIVQCYAAGNGPAEPLLKLMQADPAEDVTTALLQILGSLPASSQVPSSVRRLSKRLYGESASPELHATAEWFLRRHGYESDITDVVIPESIGYQTSEGHTMVRLPGGVAATVGASELDRSQLANERRHQIQVPTSLYFSREELSKEQLDRFRASMNGRPYRPDDQDDQQAAMRIGFFVAAAYCNWLSEQEGIPREEWVYLPNDEGNMGPGMRIVDDPLKCSGYQIPTPDLWEYACRGGSKTPRYYGFGTELSTNYIRWGGPRSQRNKWLTTRLPNRFGLFDMLGNSAEWSVGLVDRQRNAPRGSGPGAFRTNRFRPGIRNGRPGLAFGGGPVLMNAAGQTIRENNHFVVLGGAFDSEAQKLRCSDRSVISPPITNQRLTLRLMRIAPTHEDGAAATKDELTLETN